MQHEAGDQSEENEIIRMAQAVRSLYTYNCLTPEDFYKRLKEKGKTKKFILKVKAMVLEMGGYEMNHSERMDATAGILLRAYTRHNGKT